MIRTILILLLVLGATDRATAQDADNSSVLVYDRAFFEQYRPITALDMLRWIPGTADIVPQDGGGGGGNNQRGFGSGGDQILINSKRLSGKSNDISSALARIQAEAVERIEVIRGTATGLDVRSEGLLVNVILNDRAERSSGSWQIHAGDYDEAGIKLDGLVSYSGQIAGVTYLASVEYGPFNRGDTEFRVDTITPVDPSVIAEQAVRVIPEVESNLILNASGSWQFNAVDELNLNGQFVDVDEREEQAILRRVAGEPEPQEALDISTEIGIEWEFGGDLVNTFGPGQLKTRLILTREDDTIEDTVSLISITPSTEVVSTLIATEEAEGESIVRSSYTWPVVANQTVELGLEAALNTLDKTTQLFETLPDGSIVEVPLFNASASVEEERYEAFLTHFWTLSDRTVLESALNVEWSTIEQDGEDIMLSRSFEFLKPRFDFRHDLNDRDQFRATLERLVSQLDFANFVAEFDRENNEIFGGNPDLVPEKTWRLSAVYEHRLADDQGLLSISPFYEDIDDHIARIEVLPGLSAAGNVGQAKRYGVELRSSLRLDRIGIPGAVVDVVYIRQETEARDPFTRDKRPISNEPKDEVEIQFRHDIPSWRFNYVVDYRWRGKTFRYDLNFVDTNRDASPRVFVTAQYQLRRGLTLYAQIRTLLDFERTLVRERYEGGIADGNLLQIEERSRTFRQEFIAGFRGQF